MEILIIVAAVVLYLVGKNQGSGAPLLDASWVTNEQPTDSGTSWGTVWGTITTGLNEAPATLGEMSTMAEIKNWALAIKQHEGWTPGSVSYRNNNPGNLVFANQAGATGKDSRGFAIFPDEQTGMAALEADLGAKVRKYPNYSILQIMTRYLGGDPQNPPADGKVYYAGKYQGDALSYAAAVATKLGVSMTAKLGEIFG